MQCSWILSDFFDRIFAVPYIAHHCGRILHSCSRHIFSHVSFIFFNKSGQSVARPCTQQFSQDLAEYIHMREFRRVKRRVRYFTLRNRTTRIVHNCSHLVINWSVFRWKVWKSGYEITEKHRSFTYESTSCNSTLYLYKFKTVLPESARRLS